VDALSPAPVVPVATTAGAELFSGGYPCCVVPLSGLTLEYAGGGEDVICILWKSCSNTC
jgi:hypothetical protein